MPENPANDSNDSGNAKPVVASYVHAFCKPEMRHIYRQITGLKAWRSHVITHKRENPEVFSMHKRWVTVIPKYPWRFFRRLWCTRLRKVPWQLSIREIGWFLNAVHTHDARVLHIYFGHMAMHLLPLIEASTVPVVVSFHGADAGVGMKRKSWMKCMQAVFGRASAVIARSQSLVDDLIALGCPAEKVHLSRTAIPLDRFSAQSRSFPNNGAFLWLQACRLIEKKGLPTTLRAFAKFREAFPNARLRIAGEGPMLDELQSLSRDLGIDDAVKWLGFIQEEAFIGELGKAHFFLHPSQVGEDGNVEGVPNSMLEAMATGLPVLVTRHGGIPEAVSDGISGVLVAERDVDALVERSLLLAKDEKAWQGMGQAARREIEEKFSPAAQREQLETLYAQLADSVMNPYRAARKAAGTFLSAE